MHLFPRWGRQSSAGLEYGVLRNFAGTVRGIGGLVILFAGGLVKEDVAGFQKDAITGGKTTLIWDGTSVGDVLYLDSTGKWLPLCGWCCCCDTCREWR